MRRPSEKPRSRRKPGRRTSVADAGSSTAAVRRPERGEFAPDMLAGKAPQREPTPSSAFVALEVSRTKVAKRCLDFGLYRVQKSVFLGDVPPNRVAEIVLFSEELLNLETDAVYVFPMCRPDFDQVRIVGQGFDRKMVADEVLTKVI